jgi:hypothetical protein
LLGTVNEIERVFRRLDAVKAAERQIDGVSCSVDASTTREVRQKPRRVVRYSCCSMGHVASTIEMGL